MIDPRQRPDAALYWLATMVAAGEDPRFIARRLIIAASEDVGNADPRGLQLAVAAAQALDWVGLPEAQYALAQATGYLATAPRSNRSGQAYRKAWRISASTARWRCPGTWSAPRIGA
jgi:putative ATPase